MNGVEYYRTRIVDSDGKRVAIYAKTPEELYEKVQNAKQKIKQIAFRKENPTVAEYCEKWLLMRSANVRANTLIGYTFRVRKYIIEPLGDRYIAEITADDIKLALVPVSQKSSSVYRSVHMLFKATPHRKVSVIQPDMI